MSGVLYIVATPIGNLDDISLRAIHTLKRVELIAAEDTRHSIRLLNHLGIRNKLISLHAYNEHDRVDKLILRLTAGENIAVISDAGTPLISDPGFPLVRAVQKAGLKVCPIPGACSIVAALSAAGLPTDTFSFHGFLAQKNKDRIDKLTSLNSQFGTIVLLESCHRIVRLLEQIAQIFKTHKVVVAKELTKSHERFLTGTATEILGALRQDAALQKGEFVVLIDNPEKKPDAAVESHEKQLLALLLLELPLKKAVQVATTITGKKKNELYRLALAINQCEVNSAETVASNPAGEV